MTTEDLNQLKADPSVLRVYSQYVRLRDVGGGKYSACCPMHQEKTPSFVVFAHDGRWTCFGACGTSGNIFQLVQKMDNCDFKTAVEKVKKEVNGSWSETKAKVESVFRPVAEPKQFRTVPLSEFKKLEDALKSSPEAIRFLQEQRGISLETAQKMHVGFVRSIGKFAGAEGASVADKGWLAFPCIHDDKVVSIKYRSIVEKRFSRQPGMATALFGVQQINPLDAVYVCEGEFDQLALTQIGLSAVSVPSASTRLAPEQKDVLMGAACVILAGDNDTAGQSSQTRLWQELGERTYRLQWPDGVKDGNECFLKTCDGDKQKFSNLVNELTTRAKSQPMPHVYSIEDVLKNGEETTAIQNPARLRYPWPSVDRMLITLPGHVLGVGSSDTGMGKSMWTVQASLHNARMYGRTVLNFQAEMSPDEIAIMIASQLLRKHRNHITKEDKQAAAKMMAGVNYYVGRDPDLTDLKDVLDLLESAIRRLSPDLVLLDHFHHFSAGADNETKRQAEAMTRIKSMAEKYQVIFINIGQPRKPSTNQKARKIQVTDFRGSGAWGQAANGIIAIHRDLRKTDDNPTGVGPYEDRTLVQVLKGRSLGEGSSAAYLTCFGEFACFEEIDVVHEEPVYGN